MMQSNLMRISTGRVCGANPRPSQAGRILHQRPLVVIPVAAVMEPPGRTFSGLSDASLAEKLLQAEADFKSLFKSGRRAPRASEVARMRKEQNEIREELDSNKARQLRGASAEVIRKAVADTITLAATNRARVVIQELSVLLATVSPVSHREKWTQQQRLDRDDIVFHSDVLRAQAEVLIGKFYFLENIVREQVLHSGKPGN